MLKSDALVVKLYAEHLTPSSKDEYLLVLDSNKEYCGISTLKMFVISWLSNIKKILLLFKFPFCEKCCI